MSFIDWQSRTAALEAITNDPGYEPSIRNIASDIHRDLYAIGLRFERDFLDIESSVLVEDEKHVAWREKMADWLAAIDALAVKIDGGPPTPIGADLHAAHRAIVERLNAAASASSTTPAEASVLRRAADRPLPPEPPFYVRDAYSRTSGPFRWSETLTRAEIEQRLNGLVDVADTFIAMVTS